MVFPGGQAISQPQVHRPNRRRERPGSRTRRLLSRKNAVLSQDLLEGLLDARDPAVHLPSYQPNPSPLLRQNFNLNWQRWRVREAEEKAWHLRIMEEEQKRLFGGDSDDDMDCELCPAMLDVVLRLFGDIDYTDP